MSVSQGECLPWGGVRAQASTSSGLRLDVPGEGCTEGNTGLGCLGPAADHTQAVCVGSGWAGQHQSLELSFLYQKIATFPIR